MPWLRGWILDRTAQGNAMSQDSILLLLPWWSSGAPLLFFKSVSYFICLNIYDKAASQTQRSYFSKQNKWTSKICLTALWMARNIAFSVLSPLFPPGSPELGDLFRFSSLLIALWAECLLFKHSLLWTLFFLFFYFFGPLCCTLLPWWRQLSASAVLLTL